MHHPFDDLRYDLLWKTRMYFAIFDVAYYRNVANDYRARLGPDNAHLVPAVQSTGELRQLLTPEAVYLQDTDPAEEEAEVGVLFECSWEPEHRLGVRLARLQVIEVGFQDICL